MITIDDNTIGRFYYFPLVNVHLIECCGEWFEYHDPCRSNYRKSGIVKIGSKITIIDQETIEMSFRYHVKYLGEFVIKEFCGEIDYDR